METKKYIVFEDGMSLYTITVLFRENGTTEHILSTNDNETWSDDYKNKNVIHVIDDGSLYNEILINGEKIGKKPAK